MIEQSSAGETQLSPGVRTYPFEQTGLKTEVLLQRMVNACASNLAVLDESGRILYASRGWLLEQNALAANVDGLGLEHLQFQTGSGQPSPEMFALAADIQRILDQRATELHKEYSCRSAGGVSWFLVHAARLELSELGGFRVLVTREDVTRRRHAEEELRNLGGRLIRAQEDERRRIARELHDDLSQRLAIIGIEIDQLKQKMAPEQTDLIARTEKLSTRAREVSEEIHRLSYRLHPSKLDHLGLAAALESLCMESAEHQDLEVEFQQDGFPAPLAHDITLCVFRIAQESLRNVIKHSGAQEARVKLTKTRNALRLRVSDNGCGFDYGSPKTTRGLGFISMRERLRLVGGEISIRSRPAQGTQIDVLVPLG
ncbi:MAG: sensor histidine kinase [Pyrinomonadaceae bacterium]|nr:sensor histidine kinase [Pyrinomonadaceae bacterium]